MIKLSIGTNDSDGSLRVHKGLLLQHSDFFVVWLTPGPVSEKKYKDRFNTANSTSEVNFCRSAIDAVKVYSQFLYTDVVQTSPPSTEEPTCSIPPWSLLMRAYIFCEHIKDPIFCNAVMDAFIDLHIRTGRFDFKDCVKIVYEPGYIHTVVEPMRRLFADMYAYNLADDPSLMDVLQEFPKEFLVLVIAGVSEVRYKTEEDWWVHLEQEKHHKTIKEETKDKEAEKKP